MIVRKYRIGILYIEAKKRLDVSPTLSSNNTLLKKEIKQSYPPKNTSYGTAYKIQLLGDLTFPVPPILLKK